MYAVDASNLPDTLSDSASRASASCLRLFETGVDVARVDWYTNVFDETYTNLKNTDEFMQEFVTAIWNTRDGEGGKEGEAEGEGGEGEGDGYRGVRLYYPDAGSAALTNNKWPWVEGGGTVPRVGVGDVMRKPGDDGDCSEIGVFVCMKAQEKEQVELYLDKYRESGKKVRGVLRGGGRKFHGFYDRPITLSQPQPAYSFFRILIHQRKKKAILINPNLIDMGVTGLGLSGRMYTERVMAPVRQAYYLKTYPTSAVVFEQGSGYSLWREAEVEGGYELVDTTIQQWTDDEVETELEGEEQGSGNVFEGIGKFIEGMMSL
ncbi:hypothetical protein TrCOL_g10217 [Triparma columacea]|uniref:DUF1995 domain-containing protein n=1 Tax=Triparma columacea TaxID=722753 RepID=A0A9W7GBR6_9STRA|nr:hypothetical protein TrCOL_g10217 [Triparma columacea]